VGGFPVGPIDADMACLAYGIAEKGDAEKLRESCLNAHFPQIHAGLRLEGIGERRFLRAVGRLSGDSGRIVRTQVLAFIRMIAI